MIEQMTTLEFLTFLATCSGDEAIQKISQFQSGGLMIDDITVDDIDHE